jgi:hypothetical protein
VAERFNFSSSKCDFRVESAFLQIGGEAIEDRSNFNAQLPNVSVSAGSSKCDWRIFSREDLVDSIAERLGDRLRVGASAGGGSSKCDWRVEIEREDPYYAMRYQAPMARVRAASSKCDFRLETVADRFRGEVSAQPGDFRIGASFPGFRASVASSKCDWRIFTNSIDAAGASPERTDELSVRMPAARMRMDSAKCDFRARFASEAARSDVSIRGSEVDVSALQGRVGGAVASDKCDWRIRASGDIYEAAARAQGRMVDMSVRGAAFRGAVGSSKCDWSIEALGAMPEAVKPPELRAELATHNDRSFTVDLNLGLRGGPSIRLRAAGSDKCDFRIESIMESIDGVQWRRSRLSPDDKPERS